MKIAATAFITAVLSFAIGAGVTHASQHRTSRDITLRPGDQIDVPAIGWACAYSARAQLTCSATTHDHGSAVQLSGIKLLVVARHTPTVRRVPGVESFYSFPK
jgi:hypothetical protein